MKEESIVGKWYIIQHKYLNCAVFTGEFPFLVLKSYSEKFVEVINYKGDKENICFYKECYNEL